MRTPVWRLAHEALALARSHPRHLALAALVVGLLTSAASPWLVAAAAGAAAVLSPNRTVAALVAAALLAGVAWGYERSSSLQESVLAGSAGRQMAGRVVAIEPARQGRTGQLSFRARWLDGPARGEVGVIRLERAAVAPSDGRAGRDPGGTGSIVPGSLLWVSASIERLAEWEAYQRLRGAQAAMVVRAWSPTGGRRDGPSGALDAARDRSRGGLTEGAQPAQAALLRGMVLGEDESVPEQVRADFRRSGLAHLLAVSGQNVMLLAALALALAAAAGATLRARVVVALVLVVAYVPLAGGGPSIQRAGIMGSAGLVAALAGRLADRWYALLLAAAITLAVNPLAARDPGWQLSFAAVIGLLAAAAPATRVLVAHGLPRAVAEVVAITAVATAATAPLLVLHFGELSVVSLPANLLAAPAVAPVMWLGMLAAGVAQVDPALALPLTWCNGHLVAYIAWVAHTVAAAPYATVTVTPGEAAVLAIGLVATAGVVFVLACRWRRSHSTERPRADGDFPAALRRLPRSVALATAVLATLVAWLLADGRGRPPSVGEGELLVSFLDVGQGDATLLQSHGAAVLFDTGPPDGPVVERLEEAGVERLDALVLTHAQADHEGAAAAVMTRLRPRLLLNGGDGWPTAVQRQLRAIAARSGTRIVPAHGGQSIVVDGVALKVLWPPPAQRPDTTRDPNETALVTHVRHGDFDLLLPADAESGVLRRLALPPVEALKVSHHGSEDAGLPEVLTRLRPAVAAIEVGRDNSYGHPAPSTLAALSVVPEVARTDVDGTVRLRVRAGAMELER